MKPIKMVICVFICILTSSLYSEEQTSTFGIGMYSSFDLLRPNSYNPMILYNPDNLNTFRVRIYPFYFYIFPNGSFTETLGLYVDYIRSSPQDSITPYIGGSLFGYINGDSGSINSWEIGISPIIGLEKVLSKYLSVSLESGIRLSYGDDYHRGYMFSSRVDEARVILLANF